MKRHIIFIVLLLFAVHIGFSADLIDLGSSNQSASTMGFEENEYDWLLNPLSFGKIDNSTLFFALDGSANQFGQDTVGSGFRGGYAWVMDGFSPFFALNYLTDIYSEGETVEDNTTLTYDTFDSATGRYATIDEAVSTNSFGQPSHRLMTHFGGRLDGPVNFDLQVYWNMDRETGEQSSYTNQYTDTATVSDATLGTKGDLTEISWNLIDNVDNLLAVESEVGLDLGNIQSLIALGGGMYNLGSANDSWTQTVTSYAGGVDPTAMDQTVVTSRAGSYNYNGAAAAGFDMNTSLPSFVQRTVINLDTVTSLGLSDTMDLGIPLYFNMTFYPDLTTEASTITTGYNDSSATPLESSRTTTVTATSLDVAMDIDWGIGGGVAKTIQPSDNSTLYLGAETLFGMNIYSDTRSRAASTRTQQDNDGDGAYTIAGTDTDVTYTESGYEIQTRRFTYDIGLDIPLAVSYSPVDKLTFHAGTNTSLGVTLTDTSSLVTGSTAYLYETYTDNLVAANSYTQRQKDGSDNLNTPVSTFTSDFGFSTAGSFGFTLEISDNFKIDAVASANTMRIDSFSLTGIYTH